MTVFPTVTIGLTKTECEIALGAVSSMADNEHDKGVPEDAWQDSVLGGCIEALNEAIATGQTSSDLTIHPAEFGLMCDAVEIYCTDPVSEDEDNAAAQQALARRLLAGMTATMQEVIRIGPMVKDCIDMRRWSTLPEPIVTCGADTTVGEACVRLLRQVETMARTIYATDGGMLEPAMVERLECEAIQQCRIWYFG